MQQQSLFEGAQTDFGLVGDSPQIRRVLRTIHKLAHDTSTVLITGESGVGKELVARALHARSPLSHRVFLAVDSASLVGTLMESELFGHRKGAFTGAIHNKQGLVQTADGGTLFLDEIGELPLDAQAKLLRLLQEREVRPIGATQPVKVNVRILAATNRDLARAVAEGSFRKDLYYRLNVIAIHVPPLRERQSDIPLLAEHFIKKHALYDAHFSPEVMTRLRSYAWPGNIRELENVIRKMVILKSNPALGPGDLPPTVRNASGSRVSQADPACPVLPLAEIERRHILWAMEYTRGDIHTAALLLGIGKTTLYRKLKRFGYGREHKAGMANSLSARAG